MRLGSQHERKRSALSLTRLCLGALACVCATIAFAAPSAKSALETGQTKGSIIAYLDYNEAEVVTVVVYVGFSRDITFAPDEVVESVAMGDSAAFEVAPVANHIFVKTAAEHARTNMQVLTSKGRLYTFFLEGEARKNTPDAASAELFRRIVFRYPEDEKAAQSKVDLVKLAREKLAGAQREIRNINYYQGGEDDVLPDQAFDDGRFTFLRYAGSREMPAVFTVNADGTESLVDSHVEGDTVVVHRIAEKFVFRRGNSVGWVLNKNFDPRGVDTLNGTVDQSVVRVVKGGQDE